MQVQWVRTTEAFEALADEWDQLLADSHYDHPFLAWHWVHAWWRCYGAGHELAIVSVRDSGRLVGAAPLFLSGGSGSISRLFGPRVLRFLGTNEVCSEYLGFLLLGGREDAVAGEIARFLYEDRSVGWDLIALRDLPEPSPTLTALERHLAAQGRHFQRRPGWTYYLVDLPDSWDAYLKGVSKNRREQLRRSMRKVAKNGYGFEETLSEADLPEAWAHLKRLHQMRWTGKGEAGCFASEPFDRFHQAVLRPFLARGELGLSLLRRDDEVIGASYCLRRHGHVYYYQGGFDPSQGKLKPGHAIRAFEFQAAIERGDRCYDFLGGDMDYKAQLATRTVPTRELLIAAPRPAASVHYGRQVAGYHLKRRIKRMAPAWLLSVLGREPAPAPL